MDLTRATTQTTPNLRSLPNEILRLIFKHVFTGTHISVSPPTELNTQTPRPTHIHPILNILLTSKSLHKTAQLVYLQTATFDIRTWKLADLYESLGNTDGIPFQHFAHICVKTWSLHPFTEWAGVRHIRIVDRYASLCSSPAVKVRLRQEMARVGAIQRRCVERGIVFTAELRFIAPYVFGSNQEAQVVVCIGESGVARLVEVRKVHRDDFEELLDVFECGTGQRLDVSRPGLLQDLLDFSGDVG